MTSNTLARIGAGVALALTVLSGTAAPAARARPDPEIAIARDYVLASCLIKRYPGTPVAADAQTWAAGLVEQGHIPADSYARLARLADVPPQAVSSAGAPVPVLDCVTLYNSPKLPRLIAKAIRP